MKRRTFLGIGLSLCTGLSCGKSVELRESSPKKIIIIGAGISGASAAELLHSEGYEVTVLEARNRVGGRIHTTRDFGFPIDIGAAWIHGNKNNPLKPLAKKYNAKTKVTNFDNALILEGNREFPSELIEKSFSKFNEIVDKAKDLIENPASDTTLRELLESQYRKESLTPSDKKLFPYFERGLENEYGAELSKISSYGYFQMGEKIEGADELVYDGYDKIVTGLLEDINVKLGEQVLLVRSLPSGVEVETNRGNYTGDIAIITVPVSVLQKNSIRFDPPLPREKTDAIAKIPFGFYSKLILQFDEKFWSNEEVFTQLEGYSKQWYELIFNLETYTKVPVIAFLSSGERAKFVEKEKDILSSARTELASLFGSKIPKPKQVLKTNWSGDPFAMGAYTYPHRDMDTLIDLYAKPFRNIHFAGEGTHDKYFSYVHGAYLSGIREAKRILKL